MGVQSPTNTLTDAQAVSEHVGEPLTVSVAVIKTELDKHHRKLIANSPY